MLCTFSSPAHGDVTMFGDVALGMLNMMGRSDTIPSALYAEDVPAALEKLQAALGAARSASGPDIAAQNEDDEPAVSNLHRALPLIELLQAAIKENCSVMWDSNK